MHQQGNTETCRQFFWCSHKASQNTSAWGTQFKDSKMVPVEVTLSLLELQKDHIDLHGSAVPFEPWSTTPLPL